MKMVRTDAFKKDFGKLPQSVRDSFKQKIRLFMQDIKHPSLRVKKMQGHKNRWEASIDMFYRFTFEIQSDTYVMRRIGPHDKVLKNP